MVHLHMTHILFNPAAVSLLEVYFWEQVTLNDEGRMIKLFQVRGVLDSGIPCTIPGAGR